MFSIPSFFRFNGLLRAMHSHNPTQYKWEGNMGGKNKKIELSKIKPEEQLKYEIATELGLLDRVLESGWKSLTAKETGKIGGLVTKRKKELNNIAKY